MRLPVRSGRVRAARPDIAVGIHPGGDVGHRGAGLDAFFRRAGDRDEARLALHQQVVGLLVAIGTVGAVAGDIADDQAGKVAAQAGVVRPSRAAAPGPFCTSTSAPASSLRSSAGRLVLEVERQAFLGTVGPDEVRGLAPHARIVGAGEITAAGAFDLDHARTEVGQLPVQKGAAMACSRETTVMPCRGRDMSGLGWSPGRWTTESWKWRGKACHGRHRPISGIQWASGRWRESSRFRPPAEIAKMQASISRINTLPAAPRGGGPHRSHRTGAEFDGYPCHALFRGHRGPRQPDAGGGGGVRGTAGAQPATGGARGRVRRRLVAPQRQGRAADRSGPHAVPACTRHHQAGRGRGARCAAGADVTGAVAIGLPTTAAAAFGMPLMRAVRERYPRVRLQLFESMSGYISELLNNGRPDFAILFRDTPSRAVEPEPLASESLYLIGTPPAGGLRPPRRARRGSLHGRAAPALRTMQTMGSMRPARGRWRCASSMACRWCCPAARRACAMWWSAASRGASASRWWPTRFAALPAGLGARGAGLHHPAGLLGRGRGAGGAAPADRAGAAPHLVAVLAARCRVPMRPRRWRRSCASWWRRVSPRAARWKRPPAPAEAAPATAAQADK